MDKEYLRSVLGRQPADSRIGHPIQDPIQDSIQGAPVPSDSRPVVTRQGSGFFVVKKTREYPGRSRGFAPYHREEDAPGGNRRTTR